MIYFLQGELTKNVKIGYTEDFLRRFKHLTSSDRLVCLKTTDGDKTDEKKLHTVFSVLWSHGEWFLPHKVLLNHISKIPSSGYDGLIQGSIPEGFGRSLAHKLNLERTHAKNGTKNQQRYRSETYESVKSDIEPGMQPVESSAPCLPDLEMCKIMFGTHDTLSKLTGSQRDLMFDLFWQDFQNDNLDSWYMQPVMSQQY